MEQAQERFRQLVRDLLPDGTFLSAAYPSPGTAIRWGRWIELVDAVGVDGQARRGVNAVNPRPPALWEAGQQSEFMRAVARGKPLLRFIATFMAAQPFLRHTSRPALETRLIMASALAHGELPKWHTLGGVTHDRRWMPPVQEFQRWMHDNEAYLHARTPVTEVGVIWSPRSIHLSARRGGNRPSHEEALMGWYAALMEARTQFEYVHEEHLDDLSCYRVVVLPSGLALDDAGVEALLAFRRGGGTLVSCCDAGTRDVWDRHREAGSVESLLGVRPQGDLQGPLSHSYIQLDAGNGAVLRDLGDTDLIGGGRWVLPLRGDPGSVTEGAWIPEYPNHQTHLVIRPPARSDVPIVIVGPDRSFIHFAPDVDASYGRTLYADHRQLLQRAVRVALGDASRAVEVHGGGLIDVRVWEQRDCTTIYLVNLDNPMLHGPVVTEYRPQGPLEVVFRGESAVERVALLRNGTECAWEQSSDGTVKVPVHEVADFEVVAIHTGLYARDS